MRRTMCNRKRERTGIWTDQQLEVVVDAGCHIAAASRDIGILASSLRDHIHRQTIKRKKGQQGILIVEEEAVLVK